MPFYEYECSGCKYYTEVLQKLSDPVLKKCPSCGKNTFKKLVSAPVFRLKGSGWYETDFKGDKDSKRNLAGDDSKPADAKDKDGKGDKEPAKKAEPAAGEAAKPAAEKPAAAPAKPAAARSRRAAPAARPRSAAKAPAKAAKKKSRR